MESSKMRVLITGARGFVAPYLLERLAPSCDVHLTSLHGGKCVSGGVEYPILPCDLTDKGAVARMVREIAPDGIVHLGAISNVQQADQEQLGVLRVNIGGTLNLCEALLDSGKTTQVTFLLASTALVYGRPNAEGLQPVSEKDLPAPVNVYGHSKLAAEEVLRSVEGTSIKAYILRSFNHTGPGQAQGFVCPDFALRIKQANPGDVLPVGNLSAYRDFLDVRDVVELYARVLEQQPQERLFVVGSGKPVQIQDIWDHLVKISGKNLRYDIDRQLLRSAEPKTLVADSSLARRALNWIPQYDFKQTLTELYQTVGK